MRKQRVLLVIGFLLVLAPTIRGQDRAPLKLVEKIPMPNIKGRIDHMDVDVKGNRLFVAALENGTLEVVDLKAGNGHAAFPASKRPRVWHMFRH